MILAQLLCCSWSWSTAACHIASPRPGGHQEFQGPVKRLGKTVENAKKDDLSDIIYDIITYKYPGKLMILDDFAISLRSIRPPSGIPSKNLHLRNQLMVLEGTNHVVLRHTPETGGRSGLFALFPKQQPSLMAYLVRRFSPRWGTQREKSV